MAVNPNPALRNRNTLYMGTTGAGKSQALKQNKEVPHRGVRVLLYDPNEDHKAKRYRTKAQFAKVALAAVKSGRGFRIAYTGGTDEEDHEFFCRFVWAILTGDKLTFVIDEELGGIGSRTGKAAPAHARILTQGRKYGMVYHGVVQDPAEVPKTVYKQCLVKYCGMIEPSVSKRLALEMNASPIELSTQRELHFFIRDPAIGMQPIQKQFKYKKI